MLRFLTALTITSVASLAIAEDGHDNAYWPQFGGPDGSHFVADADVPVEFGEDKNLMWKVEFPGRGWSSPVIADGVIWFTTAVEREATPEELDAAITDMASRSANSKNFSSQLTAAGSVDLKLISVDLETGEIKQTLDLDSIEHPDAIHPMNSYASPTPVIDAENIYCHFGENGTYCINRAGGETIWHRKIPIVHNVGAGGSPFLYKDKLILLQDGIFRQYVMALDKTTGETVWETDRPKLSNNEPDFHKNFGTAVAATDTHGREQLICFAAQWIISYNPDDGSEWWRFHYGGDWTFALSCRPVIAGDNVIFSGSTTGGITSLPIGESGEIADAAMNWSIKKGVPNRSSVALRGDLLFAVNDEGVASCIDINSGKATWTQRLGGDYSATPLVAGGNVYFGSHDGKVTVAKARREYEVVAKNQINGKLMASPAAIDNSLIYRTGGALYRFTK